MSARAYLDWNAGAPLVAEAAEALAMAVRAGPGNPSSAHAEGRAARSLVERARVEVATLVGAAAEQVVFTSGGGEANCAALWGLLAGGGGPAGRQVALAGVEHPSVLAAVERLERHGAAVTRLPVDRRGVIGLDALTGSLEGHRVDVVCVQLANSETGVIQPVAEVAERAHRFGVHVHCDAVQAAGKLVVDVDRLGADTFALSGHKLGALSGVGALVLRRGVVAEPLIPGAQERHRRGGSENVAGIVTLGAAAAAARARLGEWSGLSRLRDLLETEVITRVAGTCVYGQGTARLPNTSCLGFPPPNLGGALVAALDLEGFAVSSGSACGSGVERGSKVVESMGYGSDVARRTVRVSLGPPTTEGEVMLLAAAIEEVVVRRKGGRR